MKNSLLLANFASEYVQVITKTKISEEIPTEDGVSLVHAPIGEEGFVVDIDDEFVYLGNKPDNVTTAVSRKDISTIKIIDKGNNVVLLNDSGKKETTH